MRDEEVLAALKGKISGETRQEAQAMLAPRIGTVKAHFEVTNANDSYAVIRKHALVKGVPDEHYLTGINDEGKHFLRRLDESSLNKPLDELIDWVNRADQAFYTRVQGDVLIQFMTRGARAVRTPFLQGGQAPMPIDKDPVEFTRELDAAQRQRAPPGEYSLGYVVPGYGTFPFWVTGRTGPLAVAIQLGNHLLTANKGAVIPLNDMVIVDAESFTLQHKEHGLKEIQIPKGHYAVLAGQRGRTLSTQVVASGFQTMGGFD